MLLDEQKKKFRAYQETLNSHMAGTVTESVNYIEQAMKERVATFKDVNSDSGPSNTGLSLTDKYSHLLKKG